MQTEITILLYFIFILAIGVYSAFKVKTPKDYYVAGKKAGFIQVSGSLLATILGGSAILGTIELSQEIGWAAIWFLFCASLGLFILIPVSRYVKRFGNYTLPELLGHFFGKRAEVISSVIIPVAWLGIIAAQIIAAAKIISGLGFLNYTNATIISGAVFILYTLLGGQLSILKTDVLQSLLIVIGLVVLVVFTNNLTSSNVFEVFKPGSFLNESFSAIDLLILVITYSVTFIVGPDIYSRLFCAKNEKTAWRGVLFVAILLIPISFALTYLGINAQDSEGGIIIFAQNLLPEWVYGLFIAALLSAVMSSADTTLLTSSLILNELFTGNLEKDKTLFITRVIVIIMGMFSIIIALFITSIIQSLLFALTFFSGAFVVPTLAGLLNLKINKDKVVHAIILGGITALLGKIVNVFFHDNLGNIIIAFAYLVNISILFYSRKK